MKTQPVILRLCEWPSCAEDMRVVSQRWWDRFLLSQAIALKIPVDKKSPVRTSIAGRGSSTDVTLESRREEGRREQHASG